MSKRKGKIYAESVEEYLKEIKEIFNNNRGGYIFRGQKDANWPVNSCAERRLIHNGHKEVSFDQIIEYQQDSLIYPIKSTLRHYKADCPKPLEDLEILAELQHFGGATMLIDFTKNALVALWFACEGEIDVSKKGKSKGKGGAVYLLKKSDIFPMKIVTADDLKLSFDGFFEQNNKTMDDQFLDKQTIQTELYYWEPGFQNQRISLQHSVFVFGKTNVLQSKLIQIIIKEDEKDKIRKELTKIHDISDIKLFDDFYGFAWANKYDSQIDKSEIDDLMNKAYFEFSQKKYKEVIDLMNKIIIKEPKYITAHVIRGGAKLITNELQGAVEDYTKIIELDTKNAPAYFYRGNARGKNGDSYGAIDDYTKAIELDPKNAAAYFYRGNARGKNGDSDGAIDDYTKAIELDPKNAPAYNNLGNARSDKNDLTRAIEDYTKAIELDPKNAAAYNNRGNAKLDNDKIDDAILDYSKALELKSNFAEAYCNRGIAKSKIGKHVEALEDFKRALELFDDDMNKKIVTGLICREEGKKEEARKHLEEAFAIAKGRNNNGMVKMIEKVLKDL